MRKHTSNKQSVTPKNSSSVPFYTTLANILSQLDNDVRFCDTHVHLEYIIQKKQNKNRPLAEKQLVELLEKQFVPNSTPQLATQFFTCFDSCIAIFCDTAALSPSLGIWQDLLNDKYHENFKIYGAFGIHPHNAKYYNDFCERAIRECLNHPNAVAYGEIGLDYHYNHSTAEVQKEVFIKQLIKAVEYGKPVVVHTREAEDDTFQILSTYMPKDWKVHLHCFTDTPEFAQKMLDNFENVFFGFTGVLTYESATQIQNVVKLVPLEKILLETDGPYMPARTGKEKNKEISHCGHIPLIASKIAELKKVNINEVMKQCRQNTNSMYGI